MRCSGIVLWLLMNQFSTDICRHMLRLTTCIRFEKFVIRRLRRGANVHLRKLRLYNLLHT